MLYCTAASPQFQGFLRGFTLTIIHLRDAEFIYVRHNIDAQVTSGFRLGLIQFLRNMLW
jgi:hypothetical protein